MKSTSTLGRVPLTSHLNSPILILRLIFVSHSMYVSFLDPTH